MRYSLKKWNSTGAEKNTGPKSAEAAHVLTLRSPLTRFARPQLASHAPVLLRTPSEYWAKERKLRTRSSCARPHPASHAPSTRFTRSHHASHAPSTLFARPRKTGQRAEAAHALMSLLTPSPRLARALTLRTLSRPSARAHPASHALEILDQRAEAAHASLRTR